ncbi:hypothetical protein CGCVW01_v011550 [Colletotrichum viniferum]|nr:hypothetical protein CGCVW01_v011550 [Colletotrichum viniferum]
MAGESNRETTHENYI